MVNKKLEECQVATCNVRQDFNNLLRNGKKVRIIFENSFNRLTGVMQRSDKSIAVAEEKANVKLKDITTV